jgi:hypothetical protein
MTALRPFRKFFAEAQRKRKKKLEIDHSAPVVTTGEVDPASYTPSFTDIQIYHPQRFIGTKNRLEALCTSTMETLMP